MYKDLGGQKIDIQGLEINLPPAGFVFNQFTNKLEKRDIYKRSEKKEEQYWEIPPKPSNVKNRLEREFRKRIKEPDYFERDLQQYRDREWDRTTNGFWFYLLGKPVFITGQHYFYLCHWTIDGDHPEFRTTDQEWHWFWEYCWYDPNCYGMLEVTQRRQGKCLVVNELCKMHDGSNKKSIDIQIGDTLMGIDSAPRKVIDKYTGIDWIYEVSTEISSFKCTEEHLLYLFKIENEDDPLNSLSEVIISVKDFILLPELEQEKHTQMYCLENYTEHKKIKVKKLYPDTYVGIETDGDHLFLLADGTVVHNSVRLGNTLFYRTSRAKDKNSGLQSKTDKDAKRLFTGQLYTPMKRLERLFTPIYDRTTNSAILFKKTTQETNKLDDEFVEVKELVSQIDFRASSEGAYDGDKLFVYGSDECGKVEKASIYKRHYVVKPCMAVGGKIIGKMLYTTTVEDIGDFDKYDEGNFQKLWDESNHLDKDKIIKQTKSGLYRYFLPADRGYEYDRYGFPKVEENRLYFENMREMLSNDTVAKVSYIRKFPLEISEAFWTPSDEGIYDQIAIQTAMANMRGIPREELVVVGNLVWKDGKRGGKVDFVETPNGRFAFNKKFNVKGECELTNTAKDAWGDYEPLNRLKRIIGVDPVDHAVVSKGYTGSRSAAYLYFKYDPSNPLSETFIAQWLKRTLDPDEFNEDIVKLAFLTGAEVLVENQKQTLITHMRNSGFTNFIVSFDGTTHGVPASEKNKKSLADTTMIYIRDNIQKVVFNELLLDWNQFNLKNSTKFDAAMAAGWALLGSFADRTMGVTNSYEKKETILEASKLY